MRRVVITGIGAVTPIGNNISDFNSALQSGVSGAGIITHFDPTNFKTKFACEIKNFDPGEAFDRKEGKRMDLFTQYAMVAAHEAMLQSGIDLEKIDLERAGVIWGSGIGGLKSLETEIVEYAKGNGMPRYNPFMIPKMISDIAAGQISIKYGMRGINYCTTSACASSSHAIGNSVDYIKLGKVDIIISGGSEATVVEAGMGGFNAMKALSERNDDFLTASRPFDKDRDGFVLGEGAGAVVLEELEHARRRGANILAEVTGSGMTADAYHITAPHPEGLSVMQVMRLALRDSNLNIDDIDYINVHGTSTPLGDIAETKAIKGVFGDHAYKLNISSTKSMTGHLLGAAGAVELIASLLGMLGGYVPPTINHFTDDPEIDSKLNLTFNKLQERKFDAFMSNTFGFGGHNSSIVVKRFKE